MKPDCTSAAFRLSPPMDPLSPSTRPQARATVFLYAPQSSAPTGSSADVRISVLVERRCAILLATESSSHATRALVITPLATSGAIVGPVRTKTGFDLLTARSRCSIAFDIIPSSLASSGARPLARSKITCEGLRPGRTRSITSSITPLGSAKTRISELSRISSCAIVAWRLGISISGKYL